MKIVKKIIFHSVAFVEYTLAIYILILIYFKLT